MPGATMNDAQNVVDDSVRMNQTNQSSAAAMKVAVDSKTDTKLNKYIWIDEIELDEKFKQTLHTKYLGDNWVALEVNPEQHAPEFISLEDADAKPVVTNAPSADLSSLKDKHVFISQRKISVYSRELSTFKIERTLNYKNTNAGKFCPRLTKSKNQLYFHGSVNIRTSLNNGNREVLEVPNDVNSDIFPITDEIFLFSPGLSAYGSATHFLSLYGIADDAKTYPLTHIHLDKKHSESIHHLDLSPNKQFILGIFYSNTEKIKATTPITLRVYQLGDAAALTPCFQVQIKFFHNEITQPLPYAFLSKNRIIIRNLADQIQLVNLDTQASSIIVDQPSTNLLVTEDERIVLQQQNFINVYENVNPLQNWFNDLISLINPAMIPELNQIIFAYLHDPLFVRAWMLPERVLDYLSDLKYQYQITDQARKTADNHCLYYEATLQRLMNEINMVNFLIAEHKNPSYEEAVKKIFTLFPDANKYPGINFLFAEIASVFQFALPIADVSKVSDDKPSQASQIKRIKL